MCFARSPRARVGRGTMRHEEGLRAAPDGPKKVGTGEVVAGITVPASGLACAPVLELADRRDLQSRAHSGYPGSIPGWGIPTSTENLRDNSTRCRKNQSRSARKVNPALLRKG